MGKWKQTGLVCAGLIGGILISLQFSAMAEKDTRARLPVEELRTFAEVFNAIKQGYVEPVEDKKLITHAISGMLSNLDPHSAYLDAEAFKELQVGTQGEFGGLGIEVGSEDGVVKVISPIEDTPAFRAGIKAGDLIIKLDDTSVKGMSLNDAVKRMRGKPKTSIVLTIARTLGEYGAVMQVSANNPGVSPTLTLLVSARDQRGDEYGSYAISTLMMAIAVLVLHFTGFLARHNLEWLVLVLAAAVFPAVIYL